MAMDGLDLGYHLIGIRRAVQISYRVLMQIKVGCGRSYYQLDVCQSNVCLRIAWMAQVWGLQPQVKAQHSSKKGIKYTFFLRYVMPFTPNNIRLQPCFQSFQSIFAPNNSIAFCKVASKHFKMKFTIAAIISLMAATISATPLEVRQSNQVTVALSNDQSGAYAGVKIQADGSDRGIFSLFSGTSVGAGGTVKATSAQLTNFAQSINCVIKNNDATIGTLTAQQTYLDLDGNPNAAIPINLNNAVIRCRV